MVRFFRAMVYAAMYFCAETRDPECAEIRPNQKAHPNFGCAF
jgi:hypothetical protein